MFQHPDEWTKVRAHTGAIIQADHLLKRYSDADWRQWFATMRSWHIQLELAVGAIKEWGPTAEQTFRVEAPIWDKAMRLGADLHSIVMDEPLFATRDKLHRPDDYAVEQTARFVALVRQKYPALLIGDIEPYPSLSVADQVNWIRRLQDRLRAEQVAPLDFYRSDVNGMALIRLHRGSWADIKSLSDAVHQQGLPFSLIYWASGWPFLHSYMRSHGLPNEGLVSEEIWCNQLSVQETTVRNLQIHPDQIVVQSWIAAPSRTLPENSRTCTFTKSALSVIRHSMTGYR
ncbi:hypothetical protein CCS01_24340 [Rhodopila globiformis]|uniref:Uncharacterized protein n=2 Tax=Rhodopila globiformis TaxID=1071 RepID=A0A2S6N1G7_RHOGL|nr:hypothetical protein CCS01_24340 [Rhodopila globiformis]